MSTETTNLGLVKPDPQELYDIAVHNGNSDKIDAGYGVTFCTSITRPPSPRPKQIIFETDTNLGYGWDGAEWIQISALSTAGVLLASLIDAKGDLIVGTSSDNAARLGVGSNGAMLVADSAQATGLRWNNNPPMKVATLPDQASIPIDPSAAKFFKLTATGSRTLQAPAIANDGQEIVIAHTASGGSSRTLNFTTGVGGFKVSGTSGTSAGSTVSGETDIFRAVYNSNTSRWHVARTPG